MAGDPFDRQDRSPEAIRKRWEYLARLKLSDPPGNLDYARLGEQAFEDMAVLLRMLGSHTYRTEGRFDTSFDSVARHAFGAGFREGARAAAVNNGEIDWDDYDINESFNTWRMLQAGGDFA